jgi:hypothetical protein
LQTHFESTEELMNVRSIKKSDTMQSEQSPAHLIQVLLNCFLVSVGGWRAIRSTPRALARALPPRGAAAIPAAM